MLSTVSELVRGQLHAPAGQVRQRRLPDLPGEAAGQGGARQVHLAGQRRDRPGFARALVQQRQDPRDDGVAQAPSQEGAPSGGSRWIQAPIAATSRSTSRAVEARAPGARPPSSSASRSTMAVVARPATGSAGRWSTAGSSPIRGWPTSWS
jgi:hypothetical protein